MSDTPHSTDRPAHRMFDLHDHDKALGARWNGQDKAWMIAPEKAEEARKIVEGAGAPTPRRNSGFTRGSGSRRRGEPGCSACRALGDYCRQCAFDEFDN